MTRLEMEIEKGRLETQRIRQEMRADPRRFSIRAGITVVACVAVGVAVRASLPAAAALLPAQTFIVLQMPAGASASVSKSGLATPRLTAPEIAPSKER